VVADDFVDRFAGWAEIEKVIHCHVSYRGTPSVSIDDNQKQSIPMWPNCNNPNISTDRSRLSLQAHNSG